MTALPALGIGRHEQAQLPGNDLAEEAEGFELIEFGVAEARQLDALCAHHGRDAQREAAAKGDGICFVKEQAQRALRQSAPGRRRD